MPTTSSSNADDLFTALGHPLRRLILHEMIGDEGEISPRDLARKLTEPLSKLSYHVRILARCGAIELVRTEQVRGSTQHFYRAILDSRWARIALEATGDPPQGGKP